jgi:aspartyl-tRNA(Asn)/glutamyl-tRNA(Gln) amidotransferase subunit C
MEEKEFSKLAKLCRISCSESEKTTFLTSLESVLRYVETLNEIPTEGVPPCHTVLETLSNVMREDQPEIALSQEEFLSNAPAHTGGMVRVPNVLKSP